MNFGYCVWWRCNKILWLYIYLSLANAIALRRDPTKMKKKHNLELKWLRWCLLFLLGVCSLVLAIAIHSPLAVSFMIFILPSLSNRIIIGFGASQNKHQREKKRNIYFFISDFHSKYNFFRPFRCRSSSHHYFYWWCGYS